jgi:AAA domain
LYREKWEDRADYRENTITRAIAAVHKDTPVIFDTEDEPMEDDGGDEYLVEALSKDHEGWFPKGDVLLTGGSSGTGKTYWVMTVLEKVRLGLEVWGHKTKARDYRVLMLDRGTKAMRRTLNKMGVSAEAKQRVIRVTSAQQARGPVTVLTEATEREPGVEAWFVEGLDMWLKEANKMSEVAQVLDDLQRLATRRNVAIIASVGSSKEKTAEGRDTERYHGRDTLFGSVAWGRKSETIVLISKTDNDPLHDDCPRQYSILVRNGRSEHFWMDFKDGELRMVDRPEAKARVYTGPPSKAGLLERNVFVQFKPGDRIFYSPLLGVSFYS